MTNLESGYEKTRMVIKAIAYKHFTESEYAFLLYLLDQQYCQSKEKVESEDSSGYGRIARKLGFTTGQMIRAVNSLLNKKVIFKEIRATKWGNRYQFNEDVDKWATTSKVATTRKVASSSRDDTKDSSTNASRI